MEKKSGELRMERHDLHTSKRWGWRDLGTLAMHCKATSSGRLGMRSEEEEEEEEEEEAEEGEDIRVGFRLCGAWVGGGGRGLP